MSWFNILSMHPNDITKSLAASENLICSCKGIFKDKGYDFTGDYKVFECEKCKKLIKIKWKI